MTQKPEFLDYEPLTRVKSGRSVSSSDTDAGSPLREAALDGEYEELQNQQSRKELSHARKSDDWTPISNQAWSRAGVAGTEEIGGVKPTPDARLNEAENQTWILRRGHSISFFGLFLFTFLVYFRPYELFQSLEWLSSAAFWVAVATLIIFIPTQLGLENTITARPREVNLILLLLLIALISIPFAHDSLTAWNTFIEYSKVVIMFIVMINIVRSENRVKALILLVLAASVLLSIAGINDYRTGNLALQGRRIEGIIGGIFSNPNDLALHLVTMVPLTVGLALSTRSYLKKLLYWCCGVIVTAGIIVTFSRGGFLALACAVFFLCWKLAPRGRAFFGVLGLIFVLTLVALAPGAFHSRLTRDASAIARTDDLKRSIFLAVRNPIFGIGMGNFIFYSNQAKATHNAYTQVAAELGLIAATFYVLFIVAPFKGFRFIERECEATKKRPRIYYLSVGLQASLIGYMVASFFASVAYLWYVYYLVGYSVCLRRIFESRLSKRIP